MDLSRTCRAVVNNDGERTITIEIGREAFLVPPHASLQMTGAGDVYLAFVGDAPMLAYPVAGLRPGSVADELRR